MPEGYTLGYTSFLRARSGITFGSLEMYHATHRLSASITTPPSFFNI